MDVTLSKVELKSVKMSHKYIAVFGEQAQSNQIALVPLCLGQIKSGTGT